MLLLTSDTAGKIWSLAIINQFISRNERNEDSPQIWKSLLILDPKQKEIRLEEIKK